MRPVRGPISPRVPRISAASAGPYQPNQPSSESNAATCPESARSAPSLRSEYASSTGACRGVTVHFVGPPFMRRQPCLGQRDLDDPQRQVPPEAHSAFSRDDALGPTDGVRLLVPYIVSCEVSLKRLYRDSSLSQQNRSLYQRTSALEPQIATSKLFCD